MEICANFCHKRRSLNLLAWQCRNFWKILRNQWVLSITNIFTYSHLRPTKRNTETFRDNKFKVRYSEQYQKNICERYIIIYYMIQSLYRISCPGLLWFFFLIGITYFFETDLLVLGNLTELKGKKLLHHESTVHKKSKNV